MTSIMTVVSGRGVHPPHKPMKHSPPVIVFLFPKSQRRTQTIGRPSTKLKLEKHNFTVELYEFLHY